QETCKLDNDGNSGWLQKAYSVDFRPLNVPRAAAFQGAHYISLLKRQIISYASGEQRFPLFL
ncbi:UNVERIFIED_CONTAM: hypothetical protein Sindi_1431600, partial [Sesamum indicum]